MDNRSNTIAGWVLAACVSALGLGIVSSMVYHGEAPTKFGYPIEGAEEGGSAAAAEKPIAALLATADPAKGAEVFKKCTACHTINQGGANGVGPNLYGMMGEEIAAAKHGFAFSSALQKVGGKWTFENMDQWLKSPRKFADGTKMTFAGLGNAEDRANILVYINAQGSNVPLPAAPAEEAAAPAADAPAEGAAANAEAPAADANAAAPAAEAEKAK